MSTSKENLYSKNNQLSVEDVEIKIRKDNKAVSKLVAWSLFLCVIVILALVAAVIVVSITNKMKTGSSTKNTVEGSNLANEGKTPTAPVTTHPTTTPATTNTPTPTATQEYDPGVCLNGDCVRAASSILNAVNDELDPCQDFYEYACSNWMKRKVLTEDQSMTGTFSGLSDDGDILLKHILEQEPGQHELDATKKAKNIYKSCNNEEAIEKGKLVEGRKFLNELGGWPVLGNNDGGNWNESRFDLMDLLVKARRYTNSPPLFDSYSSDDSKNISRYILYLDQPVLGLPDRDYFLKERNASVLMAYQNYAINMAKAFGADSAAAQTEMTDVVDFEIELANLTMPKSERRDENKMYNMKTVSQLNSEYNWFDWSAYFNQIFSFPDVQIHIPHEEPVIVRNLQFLTDVDKLIKKTQNRVIANYVAWRRIKMMSRTMPQEIRDYYQEYRAALVGAKSPTPRWKTCVSETNGEYGLAVGRLFIKEAFDKEAKQTAMDMIENLRKSMKKIIMDNDWMDDTTKHTAVEKADAIEPRIGYPDIVLNDTKLNEKYENKSVEVDNFFQTAKTNLYVAVGKNLRKLREEVDRTRWDMDPAEVNAYYDPTKNQITFPAGILQPPFYHKNFPKYLNYGGIGYVIGHEITHGFDDQGRLYDKTGLLHQWWSNTSAENFEKRAQCIINQYGNIVVKEAGEKLNGVQTQGENIADNGGIKESFYAYRMWLQEQNGNREEYRLPGLNYTANQLYFLNAANVWCTVIRPAEAKRRILVDPHSNGRSRVNGPMQNFDEFAKAFNCPKGTPMNPPNKCSVW